MINEEWKKAYKEGFADGYAAAKKEMNYQNLSFQNFPPVYYGGASPKPSAYSTAMGTPTGGLSYSLNERQEAFVTGISVQDIGC